MNNELRLQAEFRRLEAMVENHYKPGEDNHSIIRGYKELLQQDTRWVNGDRDSLLIFLKLSLELTEFKNKKQNKIGGTHHNKKTIKHKNPPKRSNYKLVFK